MYQHRLRPNWFNSFSISSIFLLSFALASCGGGGAGSSSSTELSFNDLASAAAVEQTLDSAEMAATATPEFGSVNQSSNDHTARVNVVGDEVVLTVTRADGGEIFTLDSDQHTYIVQNFLASETTGRPGTDGTLINIDNSGVSGASGRVEYTDPNDWLAGGYWLHVAGNIDAGEITGVEVGAFVDGPELRGTPTIPVSDSATYRGIAGGMYVAKYGTDLATTIIPRNSIEAGDFSGDVSLTANFASSGISGLVNNIRLTGVTATPSGRITTFVNLPSAYEVLLPSVTINSDGSFEGSNVRLTHPQIPIVQTGGSWGGKFSTVDDTAGNPRLVAGTLGGTATTSGGSEGTFLGAFYAATDEFRNSR